MAITTIDAVLQTSATKTVNTNALIGHRWTTSSTVSAVVQKSFTKTGAITGVISKTLSKTTTANASLKATKWTTISAHCTKRQLRNVIMNARLGAQKQLTFNFTGVVTYTGTPSASVNATILKTLNKTTTINAYVLKSYTKTATINAQLWETPKKLVLINAMIQGQQQTTTQVARRNSKMFSKDQ